MQITELYNIFLAHPQVTTDSRDCPAGSMFFALKGDNFDGNKFAAAALQKGCAYAVVDDKEVCPSGDERYILVDDVLQTLQLLAHEHRCHFYRPVLQITGTNGKTTTKELVSAVLAQKYNVLYTLGNFNNHIGVPKTLLRLTDQHDVAVIETGANHPGEIRDLAAIVSPDCGLITNVGVAHIEGFGSFEGVIKTKGELYDNLRQKKGGFIFLNADDEHLAEMAHGLKTLKYGSPGHGYKVEGEVIECAPFLKFRWRRGDEIPTPPWHEVQTQMVGSYNLANALAAVCVGLLFCVDPDKVDLALSQYHPTNNRSEMRTTDRNTLIVDAYNANPSSMMAALRNFRLVSPPPGREKMLILGDMKELGTISDMEHSKVLTLIHQLGFTDVWLVGENFKRQSPPYPVFDNVDELKAHLQQHPVTDKLILIKGSNSTRLFQLPESL